MSERKVINKYYPSDFDPSQLRRQKKAKDGPALQTVRIMAPFSMKCLTCGEFIYKGRKFNSRKDTRPTEKYLNIQIFFFHIKCTRCSAEIIFRTDPKNNDYTMVSGAVRNTEPWRQDASADEETDAERLDRLEAEMQAEGAGESGETADVMKELEKKTMDAQSEMSVADALDQVRMRNAARARAAAALNNDDSARDNDTLKKQQVEQDREDAAAAREAFQKQRHPTDAKPESESADSIQALGDTAATRLEEQLASKKRKKDYAAALGLRSKR